MCAVQACVLVGVLVVMAEIKEKGGQRAVVNRQKESLSAWNTAASGLGPEQNPDWKWPTTPMHEPCLERWKSCFLKRSAE